jgi:hypothetical protein
MYRAVDLSSRSQENSQKWEDEEGKTLKYRNRNRKSERNIDRKGLNILMHKRSGGGGIKSSSGLE